MPNMPFNYFEIISREVTEPHYELIYGLFVRRSRTNNP